MTGGRSRRIIVANDIIGQNDYLILQRCTRNGTRTRDLRYRILLDTGFKPNRKIIRTVNNEGLGEGEGEMILTAAWKLENKRTFM